MIKLTSRALVYRSMKQVFEFISTPENDFQWQYGILESAQISEGVIKVGTSFRTIGHFMGHRIQSTFEVTEYEPNKRYAFKSISGPLQSHTSYNFGMDRGCTKVDVLTQVIAINSLQLNEGILEKKMRKQLKEDLALLKDILEQRSAREM